MTNTDALLASQKIAVIGGGSMAEAILRGLIEAKLVDAGSIVVLNRSNQARLEELRRAYGVRIPETNSPEERSAFVQDADIVMLAMKPKDVGTAMAEFKESIKPEQLIMSVIAGLSIGTIEQLLDRPQPVARTMPNTSSTIGLGATGISFSETVTAERQRIAIRMFEAVGLAVPTEERLLDVVTGVSGSGPAYVYYMMEAMIEAGVNGGLTEAQAHELVVQTVLGAASMVKSTGESPAALRAKVTSPNGTTFAAIGVLEQHRFQEAVRRAVERASERAGEMGKEIADAALHTPAKAE